MSGSSSSGQQAASTHQLATGRLGAATLAALGVSYVVAGDYAAWNYGFANAGWGGMVVAFALMAVMYLCLAFCLAELASAMPTAGGGYAFARCAFGPATGFLTGFCVALEYVSATGAIGIFLTSYLEALTGLGGIVPLLCCYAVFLGLHLLGVGEALRMLLLFALIAIVGILVFAGASLAGFSASRLVAGAGPVAAGFLPFGLKGIWFALPFGIAFFLAVEGVALAAEEARDPERTVPRALLGAWAVLCALAAIILVVAPGAAGIGPMLASNSPLIDAMRASGSGRADVPQIIVNICGLIALAASFFSIMFAYSRQIFSLSRAGYLPAFLSRTNRHRSPWLALVLPGIAAFFIGQAAGAEALIVTAVFCAITSYLAMLASFIRLRRRAPAMPRPYRTPGGLATAAVALVLAVAAFFACLSANLFWSCVAAAIVLAAMAYFWFYSRHHLVASAPEEEFALLAASGADLR